MKRHILFVMSALLMVLLLGVSISAKAQDRSRRISPAFPIGAGEKMLVFSGETLAGSNFWQSRTWFETSNSARMIQLDLPVGSTLKRVLGDFVDQVGADLSVELVRVSNTDGTTEVVLRSFTTSGISSSNATDFKQIVSNPLSHSMLQGWTYYVRVTWPIASTGDLRVSVIKVIYVP